MKAALKRIAEAVVLSILTDVVRRVIDKVDEKNQCKKTRSRCEARTKNSAQSLKGLDSTQGTVHCTSLIRLYIGSRPMIQIQSIQEMGQDWPPNEDGTWNWSKNK